ncbi:MAG: Eco57I restriction-modification methylase domain-containing protein [Verrucomicrobiota bacterium]
MISFDTTASIAREAGVVYTRPWMVELVLDLAGYLPEKRLADLVALEPSAGDGAFLSAMVRRLVESCERHGMPLSKATSALQAFEIDPEAAEKAVGVVRETLISLRVPSATAEKLGRSWIKVGDFLEASLCFPIADFVIGNPPYIRMEEIPVKKAAMYRNGYSAMRGRADIYVAFYQAALLQLKPRGVCAYICADRWMLNDYGSALREFITTEGYNVRHIIEAHDVQAFESEVSAYPAVTIIAREEQGPVIVSKALPGIETENRARLVKSLVSSLVSGPRIRSARFDDWFHGNEPWPCSSPEALKLLKHLEATCFPLECKITGTKIGIGVATGADRVFISTTKPDIEPDRILPLALASDLHDGKVRWSGHCMANPWNAKGLVDLTNYPRLKSHLKPHHDLLSSRHTAKKDRAENWHKTIDRVNLALIRKHKLYIADIKDRLLPALDTGKTYPQHNLYWITSDTWDLKVLGALLMSAVGEFFIHCYGVRMRGGYLRFQAQYLRRIRVPDPKSISKKLADTLRHAFETQDFELATKAALEAYQIETIPK